MAKIASKSKPVNSQHSVKSLLIESLYAGPVSYYAALLGHSELKMERFEHFVKGSFRNRCHIATPDGFLVLSVPIRHGRNKKRVITEVQVFTGEDWQKKHWDSLCSAYRSSPYFEYYEDELKAIYDGPVDRLIDWNHQIHEFVCRSMGIELNWSWTDEFHKKPSEDVRDLRSAFLPNGRGATIEELNEIRYTQVFESKTGFLPNMSIFDLLFSMGPRSVDLLKKGWG